MKYVLVRDDQVTYNYGWKLFWLNASGGNRGPKSVRDVKFLWRISLSLEEIVPDENDGIMEIVPVVL